MTFDPYTNRTPWILLTEEERGVFREADPESIKYLQYDFPGKWAKKRNTDLRRDSFRVDHIYRLGQPHIDYCFDLFDDKLEWAATDSYGTVRLYEMKPNKVSRVWQTSDGAVTTLPKGLKRYPTLPEGVSWEHSLRRRGET
jgi:hypothetical protein